MLFCKKTVFYFEKKTCHVQSTCFFDKGFRKAYSFKKTIFLKYTSLSQFLDNSEIAHG